MRVMSVSQGESSAGFRKAALRGAFATGLLTLTLGCGTNAADPQGYDPPTVARGAYLVNITGCDDCHTPFVNGPNGPEPDMTRRLSGHPEGLVMSPPPGLGESAWGAVASHSNTAWAGPWGVSYTANLTPDQNTGLGIWTEDMFFQAMRKGRHMGTSRQILPPMPWQAIGQMTDTDLRAVYAYLRTLPPVTNHVPDAVVAELGQ